MVLEHEDITHAIIGAAIQVHRVLGPGFVESVYHRALALELTARGIAFETKLKVEVWYGGEVVGRHELDLLVDRLIVVELKAVHAFDDAHFAVVRSYLRAVGVSHGLLLNFARTTLQIKRVLLGDPDALRP